MSWIPAAATSSGPDRGKGVKVPVWALALASGLVACVAVVTTIAVLGQSEDDMTRGPASSNESTADSVPAGPSSSSPMPTTESTTAAPSGETVEELSVLPATPSEDPGELAPQLMLAIDILKSDTATPDEHRLAGEFEQVAARTLARANARRRSAVLGGLTGDAATIIGNDVAAAEELYRVASPQKLLPSTWHVVEPPPQARLLKYYRSTANATGVEWEFLAAIHLVETRMGRIRGNSSAGAQGPMQFMPETWQTYGEGGDIQDAEDSIMAAGRLLRARGAPGDMWAALYGYNPSDAYVRAVMGYADNLTRFPWFYRSYWSWRVLYRHVDGTYVIPVGYPQTPASLL